MADLDASDQVLRDLLAKASERRGAGDFAAAAEFYERVLQQAPRLAASWYNLALCQRMCGRFEPALVSYQQAIERGLEHAEEAHLNRAVIFADALRRDDDAERELEQALALNPAYAPALLNLANLMEDRGRKAKAEALYERALSIDPTCWLALARLAGLSRSRESAGRIIPRLESALRSGGAGPADRANLLFALGGALDQAGAYDRAFEAYRQANAASRSLHGVVYDQAATEALVERIIAASPAGAAANAGASDWSPIFICGMFRSGSTLLEQVLAGHPAITPCGELSLMPQIARRLGAFPEAILRLSSAEAAQLAAGYRGAIEELFPNVDVSTDKQPENLLHVGLIKRMFPKARIVHTARNALDNILSVYFLNLDPSMSYAFDLIDIAHWRSQCQRLASHWRAIYPDTFIDFDYDAFVASPRETAERLLEFLGLPWSDECLALDRRANAVKTASVWQVREPLHGRSSGRWRNYERHLAQVRARFNALG